jgi:pre-mRNA-splicing factor CDC5/CEF1
MRHKQKIKGMSKPFSIGHLVLTLADYNVDIPFEKQPAPGFYDITQERAKTYDAPIGATLRELEGPKRRNNEEPEQAEQIQRKKDAEQISSRSRLNLPTPQVSERELEEIVKIGQAGESARQMVDDGSNESSRGLLGEYSALSHAKNARTPRTAPEGRSCLDD